MRIGRRGLRQRYRGHMDRGSWAARTLARLGESLALALLLSCWAGAAGASAADPAPQKAPTSSPSAQPSPDPTPQAEVKTSTSHTSTSNASTPHTSTSQTSTSHTSTAAAPTIGRPVLVSSSPAPADTTAPATTPRSVHVASSRLATSPVTTVAHSTGGRARRPARHTASHRAAPARRPPPVHHTRPESTALAFPLTLPSALLALPRAALHAGTGSQPSGVLLLLSSVAMGALTLASLALLRRLRRLELR